MKAILVTKDKQRFEREIDDKDLNVGVIIRQDTRKHPPVRVFNYVSKPNFHWHTPPEFHESDCIYLDEKGLPDDKWPKT